MKIIVIDDEILIQEIIESYLAPCSAQVIKFNNIQEAQNFLATNPVDLIISDFYMPEGSGLDLINNLRSHNNLTPVILMSGSLVQGGDTLKFSAFIKKPVAPMALVNLVNSLLTKLTPDPKIGIKP
jgi:two-component system response regulator HydG